MLNALKARAARGEDVPALRSMPVIDEGGYPAWTAFNDLSGRRTGNGFGPNPISTSEIVAWLNLHEITDAEQRRDYYHLVGVLDDEWLKIAAEEAARHERTRRLANANHRRGSS